jgi:PAS domain S-box-containing protein
MHDASHVKEVFMKLPLCILHLEDNPTDAELIQSMLTAEGLDCDMVRIETRAEFLAALEKGGFDLILADYSLPSFDSLTALAIAQEKRPSVPFIFVSGTLGEEFAIETLKKGATDYVLKHRLSRLVPAVRRALREAEERAIRQRAEESLRESQRFIERVADSTPNILYVYDLIEQRNVYVNRAITRILGYTPEEIKTMGREFFQNLLHPDDLRLHNERRERFATAKEGDIIETEYRMKGADGEWHWLYSRDTVLSRTADGQPQLIVGVAEDITERKLLEAQLLQAQKLESLGTMVGGIAHDFNNMLTGILGFAQLLLHEVEPRSRVYEGLQRIEVLGDRAADMVRQLLAFSRQDVSQKKSLSLHPFLKEISKLLERMIPENIEVELNLAGEDFMVEVDPTQLQQVVMNLAVNARDAMPEGGQLRIETARAQLDDAFCQAHPDLHPGFYVRLSVSDTGTGIPPEIRSRIFDPFFTTKPVGKGTGLGLPVVYGIVKNHGGVIEVESEVGQGTTMQVYLPLTEKPMIEESLPPVEALQGTETILLVEDEPTVLQLGQTALEHFGYRVLTARDGVEALEVYQAHQGEIALVILDMVMPRMGGPEAFRELKRLDPTVKVLLVTGYRSGQETAEQLLQEAGVGGLVRKPYHVHELAQAVRAALESQ